MSHSHHVDYVHARTSSVDIAQLLIYTLDSFVILCLLAVNPSFSINGLLLSMCTYAYYARKHTECMGNSFKIFLFPSYFSHITEW